MHTSEMAWEDSDIGTHVIERDGMAEHMSNCLFMDLTRRKLRINEQQFADRWNLEQFVKNMR